MRRAVSLALLVLAVGLAMTADAGAQEDALVRAREAYNARAFDAALAAAERARESPALADAADLVAARAYLERYRESAAAEDLSSARERLRGVNPDRFGPRERLEFLVGLGTALYFDDSPGAAATLFSSALDSPDHLDPVPRERLLDWWASALDRHARSRTQTERHGIYRDVGARMRTELSRNPGSGAAAYWLAAAAAGAEDWDAAWDAALAAWIRALLTPSRAAALRADTDRLVQRAIIPERSRRTAMDPDLLVQEWELFKQRWSK